MARHPRCTTSTSAKACARSFVGATSPSLDSAAGCSYPGALGVAPVRMGRLPGGAADPHPDYEPGWITELGYEPVRLVGDHPLHHGLGATPVFRHAHSYHLPTLPDGFVRLAETDPCPIQLAAHEERHSPVRSSPEYWTTDNPDGERLVHSFLRWAGVISWQPCSTRIAIATGAGTRPPVANGSTPMGRSCWAGLCPPRSSTRSWPRLLGSARRSSPTRPTTST